MKFKSFSFIFVFVFGFVYASALYAIGAGILPVFDDGTVLIGEEWRDVGPIKRKVWSDFGGGENKNETPINTALRECREETAHYTFGQPVIDDTYSFVKLWHGKPAYKMFFARIHGQKPTIDQIKRNAAIANQRLGGSAHVEKTDWAYINIDDLMNAVNANPHGPIPASVNGKEIYAPMRAILRDRSVQGWLQTWWNDR